jgi:ABC-type amino acid transport system permease subunit
MHICFKIIKFFLHYVALHVSYITVSIIRNLPPLHMQLLVTILQSCSVVTAYGSNNRTGLEYATNTTPHGNQRLHVQWWKAPDDGHSGVGNM